MYTVTLAANHHSDLHGLFVAVQAFPTSFWCGIHAITIKLLTPITLLPYMFVCLIQHHGDIPTCISVQSNVIMVVLLQIVSWYFFTNDTFSSIFV